MNRTTGRKHKEKEIKELAKAFTILIQSIDKEKAKVK